MNWLRRFIRPIEVERVVERVVTKTILGTPEPRMVFAAYRLVPVFTGIYMGEQESLLGYYGSAEQAFQANPGCHVRDATIWQVGETWVSGLEVKVVNVPVRVSKMPVGYQALFPNAAIEGYRQVGPC